uniref:Uncharacterized protein n=1 Tax=Utricularia reniformis TaxID=192314 RepID=A0A1Y0B2D5_9LAMI|nr:hypothetical protein AEK19_MT1359 [Utricularia reniformis]ART31557.1 hypothetical protein AEK19_MT1359 [Utricularia reniformis]
MTLVEENGYNLRKGCISFFFLFRSFSFHRLWELADSEEAIIYLSDWSQERLSSYCFL